MVYVVAKDRLTLKLVLLVLLPIPLINDDNKLDEVVAVLTIFFTQ